MSSSSSKQTKNDESNSVSSNQQVDQCESEISSNRTNLEQQAKMHLLYIIDVEEARCELPNATGLCIEDRILMIMRTERSELFSYSQNPLLYHPTPLLQIIDESTDIQIIKE
jgi:hypothetical protein